MYQYQAFNQCLIPSPWTFQEEAKFSELSNYQEGQAKT